MHVDGLVMARRVVTLAQEPKLSSQKGIGRPRRRQSVVLSSEEKG